MVSLRNKDTFFQIGDSFRLLELGYCLNFSKLKGHITADKRMIFSKY